MQLNNLAEVRDFDIEECINHLEMLHKDSKGYITISSKDPNYKQWHYKSEDIIDNAEDILNIINAYVSQNTFYKPQRRIENIKELRTIYIDIDCHKTKYSKEAVKYFLEKDFYGTKIPQPNFLIDSGRGLYYVLLIEPVPSMAMPLWYAVQRYIYNQLKTVWSCCAKSVSDIFTSASRQQPFPVAKPSESSCPRNCPDAQPARHCTFSTSRRPACILKTSTAC